MCDCIGVNNNLFGMTIVVSFYNYEINMAVYFRVYVYNLFLRLCKYICIFIHCTCPGHEGKLHPGFPWARRCFATTSMPGGRLVCCGVFGGCILRLYYYVCMITCMLEWCFCISVFSHVHCTCLHCMCVCRMNVCEFLLCWCFVSVCTAWRLVSIPWAFVSCTNRCETFSLNLSQKQ